LKTGPVAQLDMISGDEAPLQQRNSAT